MTVGNFTNFFKDMDQDEQIEALLRSTKKLEKEVRKLKGEDVQMSQVFNSIIGRDCTITVDYEELDCKITDADEEWVKILVYGKKGNTEKLIRVENIDQVDNIR